MALTELTKRMQSALKETVFPYLKERGFHGGFSGFRRQSGERIDLMKFYFQSANMAFQVFCAPVFPGREPQQEEGNVDPCGYDPQKSLHIRNAWIRWRLHGFEDEGFGYFYYGHVFRLKHFLPDGRCQPQYESFSDETLRFAPWGHNPPWEKLYEPDEASCRLIAEEALRQMKGMVRQLDQTTCCRDWREFQLMDQLRCMYMRENFQAIEKTVNSWCEHHAEDPKLILSVYERWKRRDNNDTGSEDAEDD